MLIHPAIDIRDGKCVRLKQGRFERQTVYDASPVDVAMRYADAGFRHLHVVDLDGAASGRPVNGDIVRRIASLPSLNVQVGGGIRSLDSITALLDSGVARVILGSVAIRRKDDVLAWVARVGTDRIALAVDTVDGKLAAHGWTDSTDVTQEEFIRTYALAGIVRFIATDISRDGMMTGPAFAMYERLRSMFPSAELVASGGVSSLDDIRRLNELGLFGTIVGTAVLDGTIDLGSLKVWDDNV